MVKKEKMDADSFKKDLKLGLKYPWNKASRLWNILWILIPILGFFALFGYLKKIVRAIVKGKNKQLPEFGNFFTNLSDGFIIFIFMIPTFLVLGLLALVPLVGELLYALAVIFLVPWLTVNFFMKETFDSLWEIKKAFNIVVDNIREYLFAFLKTICYLVIYWFLSLVSIGIPCLMFGKAYYLAEFYKKYK